MEQNSSPADRRMDRLLGLPEDDVGEGFPRFAVVPRHAFGVATAALVVLVVVLGLLLLRAGPRAEPVPAAAVPAPLVSVPAAASAAPTTSSAGGTVMVDVAGQVRHPGVVTVSPGARVVDAVEAAGGVSGKADLGGVNLAQKVTDGEQVLVPKPGQAVIAAAPPGSGTTATGSGSAPGAPVNLNTATEADLDALPGVGPVIAGRIVEWRTQNGHFTRVDDLGEVSGIGDATLAKLRPLVTV